MSRYLTAHVITCMTRQDLQRLITQFHRESTGPIKLLRADCDTQSGRMACEWEAPDREALVDWLARRRVRFRGQEEWVMKVQLEARDGELKPV
jgi:hypothetical protein